MPLAANLLNCEVFLRSRCSDSGLGTWHLQSLFTLFVSCLAPQGYKPQLLEAAQCEEGGVAQSPQRPKGASFLVEHVEMLTPMFPTVEAWNEQDSPDVPEHFFEGLVFVASTLNRGLCP